MDVHSDVLLHQLRRGEREAFVRYYELYRARVYNFVRRLLPDHEDAVRVTEEAFTAAYRQILLHGDGADVPERTFAAALQVCGERLSEREADRGAALNAAIGADWREQSDLGRRFGQALETLQFRYQAVLLLHDVEGLRAARLATVFGVTADAAGALLFRAREEFRRVFDELSSDQRAAKCRLAELTAAGAVGRLLSDAETRRLDEHAGYCRQCRRTMKGWGGRVLGLALFLEDAPLPQALETTPVFGATMATIGASGVPAEAGTRTGVLTRIRRSLTSRAAAYALAAACLALSVGLAMHHTPGAPTFIMVQASGPNVAGSAKQAGMVVRPPVSSTHTGVALARAATRSPAPASTRTASTSPATAPSGSSESHVVATEPAVMVVADVGGASDGATPTPGRPVASSTEAPHEVIPDGNKKAAVKATKEPHGPSEPGHSASADGDHARPAETHPHRATESAQGDRTRHAGPATDDHEGKHSSHKKSKKDHERS